MLLPTVVGIMLCLLIFSATSAAAQDQTADDTNTAADDECVEFESENVSNEQSQQNVDATLDTSIQQTNDDATQGLVENLADTGQNQGGDIQQTQQVDNGDATDQQSEQNENEEVQQSQQNGDEEDQLSEQNAEDDITSTDAEENGAEECVIEETVPDELLPPTGTPATSTTDEKASEKQKASDRNADRREKSELGSETQKSSDSSQTQRESDPNENQKKSDQSETQKKRSDLGEKQKTNHGERPESNEQQKKPGGGERLEINTRGEKMKIEDRSGREARPESRETSSNAASTSDPAPRLAARWAPPSQTEVASTVKPRRYTPNPGSEMTLSARALGVYDVPITASSRREDLDKGLIRVPETSVPWEEGAQRNVYVAGHYLGHPQSASRLVFYNLHKLKKDDELVLKDGLGRIHKYRVSEKFAVGPEDSWVMGQVRNRDMLTLQTCIPPDFGKRLVVRADRAPENAERGT